MKKSIFYFALFTSIAFGCNKDSNIESKHLCDAPNPAKVNVRILNTSSYEIKDLNYENIETFNSLLPGETTSFMELESSMNAPFFTEMTIEGETITFQRIDPLGLTVLKPGCHTFLLHAYQYGEGKFITGGRILNNDLLIDFDPSIQDCVELVKSDCLEQSDKVNIRIKNSTAFDLCNIEADMNSQEHFVYGNLESGAFSCYTSFDKAKKHPLSCKFSLGDEAYIIENPSYHERLDLLPPGFYTYNVAVLLHGDKLAAIQMSDD